MLRAAFVLSLLTFAYLPVARALDDTKLPLRWGVSAGVMGSLPFGDDVGQSGAPDEFSEALWVDLEVLQFDLGDAVSIVPFARFSVLGGVDVDTVDAALDPKLRVDATGKALPEPDVTMLQLGGRVRWYPFARELGWIRPFASAGAAYASAGATYAGRSTTTSGSSGGRPSLAAAAGTTTAARRHTGLALLVGLGVRFDVPIRVFRTDMLAPIAVEAQYIKNFWMGLDRSATFEADPSRLAPEDMSLDFVGLSLTVGFLR